MKEFSFKILGDSFKGLRTHHNNPRNVGNFVSCFNVIPDEVGLNSYNAAFNLFEDEYLFDILPPVEWPFPQMFLGYKKSILCFKTKIYEIDTSLSLKQRY